MKYRNDLSAALIAYKALFIGTLEPTGSVHFNGFGGDVDLLLLPANIADAQRILRSKGFRRCSEDYDVGFWEAWRGPNNVNIILVFTQNAFDKWLLARDACKAMTANGVVITKHQSVAVHRVIRDNMRDVDMHPKDLGEDYV